MASSNNRDDFTKATKRTIERQARNHCSNPACRRLTRGAKSDGVGEINIGEAAHICAASPGGPRYDADMSTEERRSRDNGIWLCSVCAGVVDSRDSKFTVEELREWKSRTDKDSWRSIVENIPFGPVMSAPTPDALTTRIRGAASSDLAVFRRTAKWPGTTVALTLKVGGVDQPLTTRALANAVTTFDDLILVAAPGMGKTTTVFQIAESVLDTGGGTPFVVLLGEWANDESSILASVLKRPAFATISEGDFRAVASKPGAVMLLDGWNELDELARERARVQISQLRAELPELGFLISTRARALDIPFRGTEVDLLPLGDEQQMEIARSIRGDPGEALVDQAWRTPGVRELVTIPLYLTTLLSLPEGSPFPATKEELLGEFVSAHEQDPGHAAALRAATGGFHRQYLTNLAHLAARTGNTSVSDGNARRTISETTQMLILDGQLSAAISQPDKVLNAMVSSHVLTRSGGSPGIAFQHQQFQEWFASHEVERMMLDGISDPQTAERLKLEILNDRSWTEAILFATARMSRGSIVEKRASAKGIVAAFEVDPILAAEMIYNATSEVWNASKEALLEALNRWHTPGKIDRAVRFMVTSGRPEFGDALWPLLTSLNNQILFGAFRAADRFRTSVLGADAQARIASLSPEIRKNVLSEIAFNSGMDGLDLATEIAKSGGDAEVTALVAHALLFRRADRHLFALLKDAADETFDLLYSSGHLDDIKDGRLNDKVRAAAERNFSTRQSARDRLRSLLLARDGRERAAEVIDLVAEMDIDQTENGSSHLLHEVRQRFPEAFAEGLLRRLRSNMPLPYGSDDVLAEAGYSFDDPGLLEMAFASSTRRHDRENAAASILGPEAAASLIAAYLEIRADLRKSGGTYDQTKSDLSHALRDRIFHIPGASLVAAIESLATGAADERIEPMAGLLCRNATHPGNARGRPISEQDLAIVRSLVERWGERLLASEVSSRGEKASIATLIGFVADASLLPILKRLLDDNLRRYREFLEKANASKWRDQSAKHEAQHPHTHEYQQAFTAITGDESRRILAEYLTDPTFGECAARALAAHWSTANEPRDDKKFFGGVDFSRVEDRRTSRAASPSESCAEADLIFGAIEGLLSDGATTDQLKLAVTLGAVGSRLPHGDQSAIIEHLIAAAQRQQRAALLLSLVLAGEDIDIGRVEAGIAETLEAAKAEPWILQQSDAYQLRDWLRLLPFSTPLSCLPKILESLPPPLQHRHMLEDVFRGLGSTPIQGAETALFKLAQQEPRLYSDQHWRTAVLRRRTSSAARHLVDLTASAAMAGNVRDAWHWQREFSSLIAEHPAVREYVRTKIAEGPMDRPREFLAGVIAENPDSADILLLVQMEISSGRSFVTSRSIEFAITSQVPDTDWRGAYNIVPVPAAELRSQLLALTIDGGISDPAARCLSSIDKIRDQHGAPDREPRHPDLRSGRPWPLFAKDPDADDGE
ncbi:hypothetical protein [Rhizobium sp. R693]|uniref:NACHT domain-containing protein n=1 Tax=Rhizobium sp. R693 TaxID=1764276 RepID=UPI000B538BD2|nr:hypothetical protein [Rhizobium sp. R693]OWV86877.1 hypothetical protein ATY79_08685 [Rhizobium sp. R693]